MDVLLQKPFHGEKSFQNIIKDQKSLVVFVRHPG